MLVSPNTTYQQLDCIKARKPTGRMRRHALSFVSNLLIEVLESNPNIYY